MQANWKVDLPVIGRVEAGKLPFHTDLKWQHKFMNS